MRAVTLADVKAGDVIRVMDPLDPEGRLAIVDRITAEGTLTVRMRHRTAGWRWGIPRDISIAAVIAIELRNWPS